MPPRERGTYQIYLAMVSTAANVGSPIIGGQVVANASWRWLFIVEGGYGWVPADPADVCAWFWIARDRRGTLVGVVRVVPAQSAFPHEELFARHLAEPSMHAMRGRLGSLNSLAVDAAWRRRECVDERGCTGTAAALLLQRCVAECPGVGIAAMVATAQTTISVRALMRVGFHVIDPPARTHLHPRFVMCNVGAVLDPRFEPAIRSVLG